MAKAKQKQVEQNITEIRNLKGHYVWWDIKQLDIPKDKLEKDLAKLGYNDLVPRNDYKTALIRALRILLRTDDEKRFYRRKEAGEFAQFFVVLPEEIMDEQKLVTDIAFKKEMIIKINKESGRISFDDETHPFVPRIKESYKEARKFLDAQQFRTLLTRIVKEHCFGCTVKNHGGVYYVPESYVDSLENLRRIFRMFPENVCMLFETPVYNDEQTDRAIEYSVSNDILSEIQEMIEEVTTKDKEGKLTERIVGNRRDDINSLLKRIKIHENDLRKQADSIFGKAQKLQEIFGKKAVSMKQQKKFSLEDALNAL